MWEFGGGKEGRWGGWLMGVYSTMDVQYGFGRLIRCESIWRGKPGDGEEGRGKSSAQNSMFSIRINCAKIISVLCTYSRLDHIIFRPIDRCAAQCSPAPYSTLCTIQNQRGIPNIQRKSSVPLFPSASNGLPTGTMNEIYKNAPAPC